MKIIKSSIAIVLLFFGSFLFVAHAQGDKTRKTGEERKDVPRRTTEATLSASQSTLSFKSSGGKMLVDVTCNGKWKIDSHPQWCSLIKGDDGKSVEIECQPKTSEGHRDGTIVLKAGNATTPIQIYQEGDVPDNNKIRILSIDFAGFDKSERKLSEYGKQVPLNAQMIKAKITYDNLYNNRANIILSVKIINPDNDVLKNNVSDTNYSLPQFPLSMQEGTDQSTIISGFGDANLFTKPGDYYYEIYCNNAMLLRSPFQVNSNEPPRPTNNELTVSNTDIAFDKNGGSQSVYVNTDAKNFTIESKPQWVNIKTEKNNVIIEAGKLSEKGSTRRGDIFIKAGNAPQKKITVSQQGPEMQDNPLRIKMEHVSDGGLSFAYVEKSWTQKNKETGISSTYGYWNEKPMSGLQVGIRWDPYFAPSFFGLGLSTGIFYEFYYQKSDKFYNPSNREYTNSFQEHLLSIPLHLIYRYDITKDLGVCVNAGVTFDCGLYALAKTTYKDYTALSSEEDDIYGNEDFGNLKRTNYSFEYGAGIQYKSVMFRISTSKGTSNQSEDDSYTLYQNKRINVGMVIMF